MKLLFTLFFTLLSSFSGAQSIVYVAEYGSGNQSGDSWSNVLPATQLPGRLASASAGTQFWLIKGIYKPTATTDRTISFTMGPGVHLYGGFAGTETDLTQRSPQQNETILSGDIGLQNDQNDNSQILLYLPDLSIPIRIDGLTIRDSNQNSFNNRGGGGGIQVNVSMGVHSLYVTNCRFFNNQATSSFSGGGAIVSFAHNGAHCNTTLQNCYFIDNSAGYGGAFLPYSNGGTHTSLIEDCRFERNRAQAFGGAISSQYFSNANLLTIRRSQFINNGSITFPINGGALDITQSQYTIEACLFTGNSTSGGKGGAIYVAASQPIFKNCVFATNSAVQGGAIYSTSQPGVARLSFTNCHFIRNAASTAGGAFYGAVTNGGGPPMNRNEFYLTNCLVWDNTAPDQPMFKSQLYEGANTSQLTATYSDIQAGFTGTGNLNQDPLFVDATMGDYHLRAGSPAINGGEPTSTTATVSDKDLDGNARIVNSIIDMGAFEYAASPLPVSLLTLTASRYSSASIGVDWQTASETSSDYFDVQRSLDAYEFVTLARVNAQGTTTQQQNYRYIDNQFLAQTTYYRLRMVDLDGRVTYSKIVAISPDTNQPFLRLVENPVPSGSAVHLWIGGYMPSQLQLYRSMGQLVAVQAHLQSDGSVWLAASEQLIPGVYVVRAGEGASRQSLRVLIY